MRTYQKQELSRDDRGFFRYFGGRRFRFGTDEARAKIAVARLEALFQRCGSWDDTSLQVASAIAKGEQQIVLPPNPDMNGAESYAHWIDRHTVQYGDLIRFVPEQPNLYGQGQGDIMTARNEAERRLDIAYPLPPSVPTVSDGRLHEAIDAYAAYLSQRNDPSGWVRVKVQQALRLKAHKDIPLSLMTLEVMEGQLSFWANRPKVKDRDKPISALTARNQMKELRDFWKWLHRSDAYGWKRPDGWEDLKPRTVRFATDRKAHVDTFTVEELTVLYRNATPLLRTFLLLGLNCGFSIAEISSLTTDEVFLGKKHNRLTVGGENWIMRIRHKSGVYGEWKLWPHTVLALEWALRRMRRITPHGKIIMTSEEGKPFNAPTATGNKPSRIPNLWNNLYRTARKEVPDLRKLPVKVLRKTAGDLVRQVSDGEIAGVFLCHGQPVKSDALADVYTNRPFAKVFQAIDCVDVLLQSMFTAVPQPFPSQS